MVAFEYGSEGRRVEVELVAVVRRISKRALQEILS
jgi:hypothetical protein